MTNFGKFRYRRAFPFARPAASRPGFGGEPLDHPDLRRLTPRELADLPLPRPGRATGRRP